MSYIEEIALHTLLCNDHNQSVNLNALVSHIVGNRHRSLIQTDSYVAQ